LKRVLIVEDEAAIREFVVINLRRAGYEVMEAESGEQALALCDRMPGQIEVVLLDIMLPGKDGIQICKELRAQSGSVGIIMLTAKSQEIDKVGGLMVGADDYITKPFSPSELVARIDALSRRVSLLRQADEEKNVKELMEQGEFVLNTRRRTISKAGQAVEITQLEYQILEYFFLHPNVALSRMGILHRVWGENYIGEEKIVDVNVRRLRMKLEDDPSDPKHILTMWGMGYRWIP